MTTYDLHIQPLPVSQQGPSRGSMTYGFKKAIGVRGLQRVANRWLLEMLTLEGSDLNDPDRGTSFTGLIGSNVASARDVEDVCRLSVEKCNRRMRLYEAEYPPVTDADAFASATIESLRVTDTGRSVELYVRLRNKQGDTLAVQLPLRI